MKRRWDRSAVKFFAAFFGLGFLPLAPGTAGAVGGMAFFLLLGSIYPDFVPFAWNELGYGYLIFLSLFFLAGVIFGKLGEKAWGKRDPEGVVIDEAFSVFITMFCLPASLLTVLGGLALNRFFDVLKPFPLKRLEKAPGGWGIMLDDLGAGIYSHLALRLLLEIMKKL